MGGGGVVDKVVSVRSGRRPQVGSNPTTYRFEAMPFVEQFKTSNKLIYIPLSSSLDLQPQTSGRGKGRGGSGEEEEEEEEEEEQEEEER
ncbi:hypothetical protein E2C01_067654 [Portunus trituberculatus]|uniref:Uncharacterized protein n=1 Tax=Portunus trituberculatus TaxID=210409 RepID=A0A5B7HLL7_PORTR|nr:hypothetical protein [Portunus trituberculatus]